MLARLCLAATLSLAASARADDADKFPIASRGSMPLILSAPHDGGDMLGLRARTKGVTVRDMGTAALAQRVAQLIEQKLGQGPYLVVAKFSRKVIDANRAEAGAFESPAASPAYRAYHGQLAAYVADIRRAYPGGALLLDLHGQAGDPNRIFRGTRAGLTMTALTTRFGAAALQGDASIIGLLASKGYPVFPAVGAASMREDPRYDGGYTVFAYGSENANGIDAIQLELGKRERDDPQFAIVLADAIVNFMMRYQMLAPQ